MAGTSSLSQPKACGYTQSLLTQRHLTRVSHLSQWDFGSGYIGEPDFCNKQVVFCYSPDSWSLSLTLHLLAPSPCYAKGICAGLPPTNYYILTSI